MPNKNDIVCELGTGCCTIPLWWNKYHVPAKTFAVEIQDDAYDMACRSIKLNSLDSKIHTLHIDIKNITNNDLKFNSFDRVVCNPPYKPNGTGITNQDTQRTIARHEQFCSIEDILKTTSKLLKPYGKFFLCSRPERLCDIITTMRKNKIEPKKIRFVQQRKNKEPKLFLIEGIKCAKPFLSMLPTLFIEDESGNFSNEIKQIYKDYEEI